MKNRFLTIFAFFLIVLLYSCTNSKEKMIAMRLAESYPSNHPSTKACLEFAKITDIQSKNKIKIEVMENKKLGEEKAVIELVQIGAIELARVSSPAMSYYSESINILQTPFLYRNTDHMWKVLNGQIGDEILLELEKSGFKGLCWFDSSTRNFYNSKKEVKLISDFKNLRIAIPESKLLIDMIKILKGIPKPLQQGSYYTAFQSNIIDGAEDSLTNYYISGHYKLAKYYTIDEHIRIPEILIMNLDLWNELSDQYKMIIKNAADEARSLQIEYLRQFEKKAEEKLREAGCILTEIKDKENLQKMMKSFYNKLSPESRELVYKIINTN